MPFTRRKDKHASIPTDASQVETTIINNNTNVTSPAISSVHAATLGDITAVSSSYFIKLVQRAHESIARLQRERISEDELDEKGVRVLEELRQVLVDMHTFLTCKNTDVLVKSLFSHTGLLAGDIRQDRQLGMHLIDWRSSGSESTLTYIYQLINSLKETRDIFGILASVLRLIEEDHQPESSMHDAMFEEFVALMRAMSHNSQWRALIARSRAIPASDRILPSSRPTTKISERPGFMGMEQDMKHILASLMGEQENGHVDGFFANMKAFVRDVRTNPLHREFVVDVEEVLAEITEEPEVLDDPAARMALRVLYNSAIKMLSAIRGNPNLQAAKQELTYIGQTINQDPISRSLIDHLGALAKDVTGTDDSHAIDYKLVNQFRRVLVPLLIETFREIRLPPIKGVSDDKKMKYHVHGIVLSSIELLPENIKIESTYKINSDPLHLSLHEHDTILWVEVERIRAHVKGTAWGYERLSFPKLKDEGLASVSLGGYGARVGLKLRVSRQGAGNILQVLDSYCVIDRLDVALYECNHKFLYKFLHHHIVNRLKTAVEQSISDKLSQCITIIDHRLMSAVTESKKQHGALNSKITQAKSVFKSKSVSRSRKNIKQKVNSPSTKRRALQLLSKARESAEARAPAYYKPSDVPLVSTVATPSTSVITNATPTLPSPYITTTTTTSSIIKNEAPVDYVDPTPTTDLHHDSSLSSTPVNPLPYSTAPLSSTQPTSSPVPTPTPTTPLNTTNTIPSSQYSHAPPTKLTEPITTTTTTTDPTAAAIDSQGSIMMATL